MLPAHWTQRAALVTDLVKCWGCSGRSIVFTETKNDANELAGGRGWGLGGGLLRRGSGWAGATGPVAEGSQQGRSWAWHTAFGRASSLTPTPKPPPPHPQAP
jgi:hypothetical protein